MHTITFPTLVNDLTILPKAECANPRCSVTLHLSDMDSAISTGLFVFYVLLKVIREVQQPKHVRVRVRVATRSRTRLANFLFSKMTTTTCKRFH